MAKKKPEARRVTIYEDGRTEVQYSDGSIILPLKEELQLTIEKLENLLQRLQKDPNDALLEKYIEDLLQTIREFEGDRGKLATGTG